MVEHFVPMNPERVSLLHPPILQMLRQSGGSLSEYQLLRGLEKKGFPLSRETAQLALFQKHFTLRHALYRLQASLLEEGYYLAITPLKISLQASAANPAAAVQQGSDAALREFYLDWSNCGSIDHQGVRDLLQQFWQRFYTRDQQAQALTVLGLDRGASLREIKRRYRQLAGSCHPDKGGDSGRFIRLREAYETLKQGCF